MSRILLPLAIIGSVLAQVPVVGWENLSSQAIMGGVLVWLVTKTMPAHQTQISAFATALTTLATTFAGTVEAGQKKDALIAEHSATMMTGALANLSTQHQLALETGAKLATAIGETRVVLAGLQLHCAKQAGPIQEARPGG